MYLVKAHLALAEGALGAMFNPGGATEARDAVLVRARLGDVVADGVGLAGVGDAAGTALALGHRGELAVHGRARQGPAVHLPLLPSRWDGAFQTGGERTKADTVQNNPRKRAAPLSRLRPVNRKHRDFFRCAFACWRQRLPLMEKVREQEILDEQSNLATPSVSPPP